MDSSTISIIPEEDFQHGDITRDEAVRRLKNSQPFSFLVREREPTDGYLYALSFYSNATKDINHYRIKCYGGHYIMGKNSSRSYQSLSHLVLYFSDNEIAPDEYCKFPLKPPENSVKKVHVKAILPHAKVPGSDELDFQKGDIMVVEQKIEGSPVSWCKSLRTEEFGFIDDCFVEKLSVNYDPVLDEYDFYHGTAELDWHKINTISEDGDFLLKSSENDPSICVLCVKFGDENFRKFMIGKIANGYTMKLVDTVYTSIDKMIEHYNKNPIYLEPYVTLGQPISKLFTVDSTLPEDIYGSANTFDSTDLFANKIDIVKEGLLFRRSQRSTNKKWKLQKVTVNKSVNVLSCFENTEKVRKRAKRVVDLQRAVIYPLDASLYGRGNAFQLVTFDSEEREPTVNCFAANSAEDLRDWLNKLRPLCKSIIGRVPPGLDWVEADMDKDGDERSHVRHCRSLYVAVSDARGVSGCKTAHITVSLNTVKVAKTMSRERESNAGGISGNSVIPWDEEFTFDDLPADIISISVTLHTQPKKRLSFPSVSRELTSLSSGCTLDENFQLPGSATLRLRLRYTHQTILPQSRYVAFRDTLFERNPDLSVVSALADMPISDQPHLARSLLLLFTFYNHEESLMMALCRRDIDQPEAELSTLFRGSSLAVGVLDAHMEREARAWVHACLAEVVRKVVEGKTPLELDTNRLQPGESAERNLTKLKELLAEAVSNIFCAVDSCPPSLRRVCAFLQECVQQRWPELREPARQVPAGLRTRVVSSFLFLRLLAPALNFPKRFGLVSETPADGVARTLLLLSKALQNLSGLVKAKEPFMAPLNSFIEAHHDKMLNFVAALVDVSSLSTAGEAACRESEFPVIRPSRELANIHAICACNTEELRGLIARRPDVPGLQQLLATTNALTRHLEAVKLRNQQQNQHFTAFD